MFALKKTLQEPKRGRFYLIFDEIVTHISLKTSKPNPLRKWPKFCTYCMNKNTIVSYVLKDNKKDNKSAFIFTKMDIYFYLSMLLFSKLSSHTELLHLFHSLSLLEILSQRIPGINQKINLGFKYNQ